MNEKMREIIQGILKVLSDTERVALLKWAENCQLILNETLPIKDKIKKLVKVTSEHNTINHVLVLIWKNSKKHLWVDRGFVARVTIVFGGIGLWVGGGAGLAIGGGAISIPFFLVTASGGAFLGMLIEELKKKPVMGGNDESANQ